MSGTSRVPRVPSFFYRLYERRLERELEGAPIPGHVGVILDGNRRWAQRRQNGAAAEGHRAGAAIIGRFLDWCDEAGIQVVTLYLLSVDNLKGRAHEELEALSGIIARLATELGVSTTRRIHHVGAREGLPADLLAALDEAESATAGNEGLTVNLAVGYGGRREIADAVRRAALEDAAAGRTLEQFAASISEQRIADHLYTGGQPDPALILRTSGEQRLSDFLLWQSAHSELSFTDVLWPDFRKIDFLRALRAFAKRQRRFGA